MANNNDFRLPSASGVRFSACLPQHPPPALRIVTEPMLATRAHNFPKDAIRIDANETPWPGASARERHRIVPQGGLIPLVTDDLVKSSRRWKPEAGTGPRLCRIERSASHSGRIRIAATQLLTADPGYEAGMFAAMRLARKW